MARETSSYNDQRSLFGPSCPKQWNSSFSGGQPNTSLRPFLEDHIKAHPYSPETDTYAVPAFDTQINTSKVTALYNLHTYWSKKPHDAIRQYIRHYTQPGDVICDPFCGSGGTALAALLEGRKAIAIDRSPAATFITANSCLPVDVQKLQEAFETVKRSVKPQIDWLYETCCERCGGKATTTSTVYSQVFQCPRCMTKVPLFECIKGEGRTVAGKPKTVHLCPHCYKKNHQEVIRSQGDKFGMVPVRVVYRCEGSCEPRTGERLHNDPDDTKRTFFEQYDLGKLSEIEALPIPYHYPQGYDMRGFSRYQRDALRLYHVSEVADMFTKRNLWALAAIKAGIEAIDEEFARPLLFAFSGILLGMSRMNRYRPEVSYPTNVMEGTYYLPQIMEEAVPWKHFENKCSRIQKFYQTLVPTLHEHTVLISTESACNLSSIPTATVDYIFTDPPYAEKIQYGELNYVWEAWLNLDTNWHSEEIIVNPFRGKTEADWAQMMRQAMAECHRILKPGRYLSLCYHDTSEGTWALIQDIMADVGFSVDTSSSALFIETEQKSYNQRVADKVNKRDLVINFYVRKPGMFLLSTPSTGEENDVTFNEKVRTLIREYLLAHPGTTKDRIYDEVVSRMVRARRMQAHNFHELLSQIAEEVHEPLPKKESRHAVGHWYLKETEIAIEDVAESAKEAIAATSIQTFMEQWLSVHKGEEGVHYSYIFEHYLYQVTEKPRRELHDWLLDYFYKTPEGTYRFPNTEEEEFVKVQSRETGMNRRIKRFLAYLCNGEVLPPHERPDNATFLHWIRHCKRAGMYEQGKQLYEQGGLKLDTLTEEMVVAVEEDYQVCVRMLSYAMGRARQVLHIPRGEQQER